jgi:hypothetical protein
MLPRLELPEHPNELGWTHRLCYEDCTCRLAREILLLIGRKENERPVGALQMELGSDRPAINWTWENDVRQQPIHHKARVSQDVHCVLACWNRQQSIACLLKASGQEFCRDWIILNQQDRGRRSRLIYAGHR